MVGVIGLLLVIAIPMLLLSEVFGAPSAAARRIVFRICTVLSLTAGVLWLLGLDALPLVILAYMPAYQMQLHASMAKQFRNNHGREMQLIASGIVTDPELKKDARYSTVYFFGALGAPLLLFVILVSLSVK